MNQENQIQEIRKELQTLINSLNFCWVCGRKDMITNHHAIPQKIRGVKMNLTVPICKNCVEIIHKNDELSALIRRIFLR